MKMENLKRYFIPLVWLIIFFGYLGFGCWFESRVEKRHWEIKKAEEESSLAGFKADFESGRFVPEPGYYHFGYGCCDPGDEAYMIFTYAPPKNPVTPTDPTAYEIRYYRGRAPGRTVWYRDALLPGLEQAAGYGTKKTYAEFLEHPEP
jgi:hypothetical protein